MKILQTISSLSASSGGPSTCTHDLMVGLRNIGAPVDLLTMESHIPGDKVLGDGAEWLHKLTYDYRTPLALSPNFDKAIAECDYDLYHCNGLWMGVNHSTCAIARKKHKPCILSPHGMLYPTALKISYWKKWPLLKLWYNKDIHSAACIHATCQQEAEHVRSFGYKGPIAVIPNCVVFPEYAKLASSKFIINGRKQIGFLGRLHPIKKVEQVLYAMALLTDEERSCLSFQIMGKYDDQYEQWLKDEVVRLRLDDCVEFVGFVNGEEKYRRLQNLWALMVPSSQENFGMIVPEALICGTPVYASLGTPWGELNEYQCGWWKENSAVNIAAVLRQVISMSEEETLAMGARGRKLMEDKYEQDKVAQMMYDLYKWLIGQNDKPDFVKLYGK